MKKTNKVLIILIITILMISICNQIFAATTIHPSTYMPSDPTASESALFVNKVKIILGMVKNVSVVVAVITIMSIGIKYMMASVEERANYKATMLPYVIGCLMAATGTTLVSYIYNAMH